MGIIKSQPDLMENKFPEIIEIDARLEGFLERYDEEIIKIRPSAGKNYCLLPGRKIYSR